jgi:phage shock protein PspC (stress-responsive transcriptional regulator)|tara:strand:+ start:59 stop:517 length:459 start_codon:yes stop_codon:yes gene_type:complete
MKKQYTLMGFLYTFFQKFINIVDDLFGLNKVFRIIIRVTIFVFLYVPLFIIFNSNQSSDFLTLILVLVSWFGLSKPISKFLVSKLFSNLEKKNDKPTKPILRFPKNGYVGGVCHGIGVYTSTPPIIWRIISVLGISGAIFIYPTLWIFLKKG